MEFKPVVRCGRGIRALCYESEATLAAALVDTLATILNTPCARPTGIILAGGSTPLAAYGRLSGLKPHPDPLLRVFFSDDRLVPPEHDKSNFNHIAPLVQAAGLAVDQIVRVRGEWPLDVAVQDYHHQLESFLASGGEFALGLLGLGADGHTASLFTADDLMRGGSQYAVGVQRPDGLAGVSVTPALLHLCPRPIFIVTGTAKRPMTARLLESPPSIPAAQAVAGHRGVELWTDRAAWPDA